MYYDCILVNGDSYSAPKESLVWADHLSTALNLPLVNLAVAGSNNKRILRSTIECLESDAMIGKRPLVVIGWSFLSRMEVWYYGNTKEVLERAPDNQSRDVESKLRFITLDWILGTKDATDYHKNLVSNGLDEKHKVITDFYTDLFLITQYLKYKQFRYFFFSSGFQEEYNPYWYCPATDLHLCYHTLNDPAIKNFSDFSLAKWARDNDPQCEKTYHLSTTGHKTFSQYLRKLIDDI